MKLNLTYPISEMYGNEDGAKFLERKVQEQFNQYPPASQRVRLYDVKVKNWALNIKTADLNAGFNKGRLGACTVITELVENLNNELEYKFIFYKIVDDEINIIDERDYQLEELEYDIGPQGWGLLQPIIKNGKVQTHEKISREEWLIDFSYRYEVWGEKQIIGFQKRIESYIDYRTRYNGTIGLSGFFG